MRNALLILWVALLGADRVNLLEGAPFVFTPFLALTPVVVVAELLHRIANRQHIAVPRPLIGYMAVTAALAGIVFASVSLSASPSTSSARALFLAAQIGGTLAVALLIIDRDDLPGLLARGAALAVVVFVAFDAIAVASWVGLTPLEFTLGPMAVNLESFSYAGVIPRLSGPVADPNRAGWSLIFIAYLIGIGERRPLLRRTLIAVTIAMMVLTLSRSTLLAATATFFVHTLSQRPLRFHVRTMVAAGLGAAAICAALIVVPDVPTPDLEIISPLAERFSVAEGSAQSHVGLMQRGLEEATETVPRTMLGIGYGSSYLVLQDVFPGNRYGNFHSLYVTIFAEAGIFALILTLLLFAWPLVRGSPLNALLIGAAVFSVFYQATTDASFWFTIALSWALIGSNRTIQRSSAG
jgi:hypothetical protein